MQRSNCWCGRAAQEWGCARMALPAEVGGGARYNTSLRASTRTGQRRGYITTFHLWDYPESDRSCGIWWVTGKIEVHMPRGQGRKLGRTHKDTREIWEVRGHCVSSSSTMLRIMVALCNWISISKKGF